MDIVVAFLGYPPDFTCRDLKAAGLNGNISPGGCSIMQEQTQVLEQCGTYRTSSIIYIYIVLNLLYVLTNNTIMYSSSSSSLISSQFTQQNK